MTIQNAQHLIRIRDILVTFKICDLMKKHVSATQGRETKLCVAIASVVKSKLLLENFLSKKAEITR